MIRLRARMGLTTLAVLAVSATAGCRGQTSEEPPVVVIRNMYDQPRYDSQERGPFFADNRVERPAVPGTVAREDQASLEVLTGREDDGSGWVATVPAEVADTHGGMEALVTRGQDRYGIYCTPCHGMSGDGEGMIARRAQQLGAAALKPPTFHDARLRSMPDGQLFATISNGIRNMPPYRHSVPVEDRWAIVSYVRALQISQAGRKTAMNDVEERP
ncbi:MAG: c-type cytochrome [Myxococcota bacterium]